MIGIVPVEPSGEGEVAYRATTRDTEVLTHTATLRIKPGGITWLDLASRRRNHPEAPASHISLMTDEVMLLKALLARIPAGSIPALRAEEV